LTSNIAQSINLFAKTKTESVWRQGQTVYSQYMILQSTLSLA